MKFTIITVSLFAVCAQAFSFSDESFFTRAVDVQLFEFSTRELVQELESRLDTGNSHQRRGVDATETLERRGKLLRKLTGAALEHVQEKVAGTGASTVERRSNDSILERRGKLLRKLTGAALEHVQEKVAGTGASTVERRSDESMTLERRGKLLRKLAGAALEHAQEKVAGSATTTE